MSTRGKGRGRGRPTRPQLRPRPRPTPVHQERYASYRGVRTTSAGTERARVYGTGKSETAVPDVLPATTTRKPRRYQELQIPGTAAESRHYPERNATVDQQTTGGQRPLPRRYHRPVPPSHGGPGRTDSDRNLQRIAAASPLPDTLPESTYRCPAQTGQRRLLETEIIPAYRAPKHNR